MIKRLIYISRNIFLSILNFISFQVSAQQISSSSKDSSATKLLQLKLKPKSQKDLIDYALIIIHKNPDKRADSIFNQIAKFHIAAAPITEYTPTTGLAGGFVGIAGFLASSNGMTNTSTLLAAVKYTQKKQFLLPIQSSVWTKDNKYNFIGDWRFLNFPQETYGFGGFTSLADGYIVDYKYIRIYQYGLRKIKKNIYAGIGYQLDYHWGISEVNLPVGRITDFEKYGFTNTSVSSGIALNILYDSRKNSINPEGGSGFGNIIFRQNATFFGSNSNWNSVIIDLRKYLQLPHNNILAFWTYNVFTLNGNPPYLDLPGTSTDSYNNTGRGYVQDRFTGKKYD